MSEGNGYASLDTLITKRAPPEVDVDVPGLGKFRLRGFTVSQRTRFEAVLRGVRAHEGRAHLLVNTIIRPEGLTAAHVKMLNEQDALLIEPLVEAAIELTKIDRTVSADLLKNSEATAGADSTSS